MARRLAKLPHALAAIGLAALVSLSCSSKSNLTCGPGTAQQGSECVASLPDASLQGDAATDAPSDAEIPALPPRFGGITALAPVSATGLLAVWSPGVDLNDPSSPLGYRVFAAPAGQSIDYSHPVAYTMPGALSAVVGGLSAKKYVVGVRAVNAAGLEDSNTATLSATPAADTTPPTFGGLTGAGPGGSGAVKLKWSAASDDQTPPAAITYLVFMSATAGAEDFTSPVLVTAPGATSATVDHLANASQARFFVVLARDAAGNLSSTTNPKELSAAPGPDTVPPVFGGCTAAANVTAISVALTWNPAVDDVTLPANIKYEVLASTTPGDVSKFSSIATATGQSQVVVPGLSPSSRYYFICRAIDEAGNEDQNTVEVSAATGANPSPPVFVANVTIAPVTTDSFSATLSWDALATDTTTAQDQIVYDVYESTTSGTEKVNNVPQWSSAAGASSVTVSGLTPNSTLYFIVCARNQAGNHACASAPIDGGSEERMFPTPVSFAQNVAPIFTHNCGVVGCHVPGNPTGGLVLAQGFAYASIVGVHALEATNLTLKPDASFPAPMNPTPTVLADGGAVYNLNYVTQGDYSDSLVYIKTHFDAYTAVTAAITGSVGSQMPAPATGGTLTQADLDAIQNWIAQGAANN